MNSGLMGRYKKWINNGSVKNHSHLKIKLRDHRRIPRLLYRLSDVVFGSIFFFFIFFFTFFESLDNTYGFYVGKLIFGDIFLLTVFKSRECFVRRHITATVWVENGCRETETLVFQRTSSKSLTWTWRTHGSYYKLTHMRNYTK